MLPSLFVSHGSPDIRLRDHEVRDFLATLGSKFDRPKSIIVISAHWFTQNLEILANPNPNLIYDFYGFPKEMYEVKYPIKNDTNLVNKLTKSIEDKGFSITQNKTREGYDHGVWSILSLMYPNADIPVVQISLPLSFSTKDLFELGKVLKDYREDSLIIGSGNVTHNLRDVDWYSKDSIKPYAKEFRDWLVKNLENSNVEELLDLRNYPKLRENHPSFDHLLPIFINMGSSNDVKGESLLENYMFGNLAMDTISFKG
jgi:4,5-DOPA dioxygenase extradiol